MTSPPDTESRIRRRVRHRLGQLSPHAWLAMLAVAFLLAACGKGSSSGY